MVGLPLADDAGFVRCGQRRDISGVVCAVRAVDRVMILITTLFLWLMHEHLKNAKLAYATMVPLAQSVRVSWSSTPPAPSQKPEMITAVTAAA